MSIKSSTKPKGLTKRVTQQRRNVLLSLMIKGLVRWEPWNERIGSLRVGSIHYSCGLDSEGIPIINDKVFDAMLRLRGSCG